MRPSNLEGSAPLVVAGPTTTPDSAPFTKISAIGPGHIRRPTAAAFAGRKIRVVEVKLNRHAVQTINRGDIQIVEPDLDLDNAVRVGA